MKIVMLPELACQTGNFASFVTCPASTYKLGNVVKTSEVTSHQMRKFLRTIMGVQLIINVGIFLISALTCRRNNKACCYFNNSSKLCFLPTSSPRLILLGGKTNALQICDVYQAKTLPPQPSVKGIK